MVREGWRGDGGRERKVGNEYFRKSSSMCKGLEVRESSICLRI